MSAHVPTLSIIIPALDEAEALPRLLEQLGPARERGAEIIVVDGGSRDATVALAEAGGARVLHAERGRARQLQAGVDASTGEALWLLHADSDIDPFSDQHIVWSLAEYGRLWGWFSLRLDSRQWLLRVVARAINIRSRLSGIATGDQGIFVLRRALQRIGGIPQQPLMEDVELSVRLRQLGPPEVLLKRITTSARHWQRRGVLRTVLLMWRLRLSYALGGDPDDLAQRYRASSGR
ncbi:MAG: TIGR04283 family arsenosugar biosynthesis glycosyltransferase [Gammaproteobacteria bacterium]|nr:TIGR04283 family arsenosugar biosynthesis glycosyltransferase [Gammaproteobacteria bacterium]